MRTYDGTCNYNPSFLYKIVFINEGTFCINGKVNQLYCCYWLNDRTPHKTTRKKMFGPESMTTALSVYLLYHLTRDRYTPAIGRKVHYVIVRCVEGNSKSAPYILYRCIRKCRWQQETTELLQYSAHLWRCRFSRSSNIICNLQIQNTNTKWGDSCFWAPIIDILFQQDGILPITTVRCVVV